jgi:UDP-glucose 4-epimerase
MGIKKTKLMRFFLTGISGFIAKHLAKRLIQEGHEVDILWHCNKKRLVLPFAHTDFKWVDISAFDRIKYDYVIHLGATTSISKEFNPDVYFNNIIFAQKVLSTPYRTIYASSTSVYELNNPYAYSKAFNEHLGDLHGNALGLRFFNVYGQGNNKGIVKRVIDCCLSGEPLTLQGGNQVRDFIYIDDVVDIIIDNLDNPLKVMDVGTGVGTKILDVVHMVQMQMMEMGDNNDTEGVKLIPSDYAGEQMESIAHSNPVKDYTPLREGIRKTIEETLKKIG